MKSHEVQYPFARNEKGELVDILTLNINNRYAQKFYCPECGFEMRPRLGKKLAHCFYHFCGSLCNQESYIHRVGKELLYNRFYSDQPFFIDIPQNAYCERRDACEYRIENIHYSCDWPTRIVTRINLKDWYDVAEIEKEYFPNSGVSFRPDVLLTSSLDPSRSPVFLEIRFTHPCSEDKVKSGIRILELKIDSIADLERIPGIKVFSVSEKVSFYNFKKNTTCTPNTVIEGGLNHRRYTIIPCTSDYQRKHPPFIRVSFFESGLIKSCRLINKSHQHDSEALFDITYDRRTVPNGFSATALVVRSDARFRDCRMCTFYSNPPKRSHLKLNVCRLARNTHYSTSDAKDCASFHFKDTSSRGFDYDSLIDGKDYFSWHNHKENS